MRQFLLFQNSALRKLFIFIVLISHLTNGNAQVCGDNICDSFFGENCANCPGDCPCPPGQECIDSTCTYVVEGNVGINNTDPKTALDIHGGLSHRSFNIVISNGDSIFIPENLSLAIISGYYQNFGDTIPVVLPITLSDGQRLIIQNKVFVKLGISLGFFNPIILEPNEAVELIHTANFGWSQLSASPAFSETNWKLQGNNYTNPYSDFIGTKDETDLVFRTNNVEKMRIAADGSLDMTGAIKTNGQAGVAGQLLMNNGNNTMSWSNILPTGSMIEVSPFNTDTSLLREQGYTLIGSQTRTVQKTTTNGGDFVALSSVPEFNPDWHLFYHAANERIFVVKNNQICGFSLNESTYGNWTCYITPGFNLTNLNTVPIYTGTEIIIFPGFRFNCNSLVSISLPSNPCGGFVNTTCQVWSGTEVIIYGPEGGLKYNPTTNIITCFEYGSGNFYKKGMSVVWTGNLVLYYGGYILVSGDTISTDIGISYNPSTNVFDDYSTSGQPRCHDHIVIWTGTEMLIFGGYQDESGLFYSNYNFYNPTSEIWNQGFTPYAVPFLCSALTSKAFINNNKLFVFNVKNIDFQNRTYHSDYFSLTAKTDISFTTKIRNAHIANLCNAVLAGNDIHFFPFYNNLSANIKHFILTTTTPFIYPGFATNLMYIGDYKIASDANYILSFGDHSGGLIYDIIKKKWKKTNITNQPIDRKYHDIVSIGANKFLLWGGINGTSHLNSGAIYDAIADSWTTLTTINAPSARVNHSMACNGNKVFIYGGQFSSTDLFNGAIYNTTSSTWTNINLSGVPSFALSESHAYQDKILVLGNAVHSYNLTSSSWSQLLPTSCGDGGFNGTYLFNNIGNAISYFNTGDNLCSPLDGNGVGYGYFDPIPLSGNSFLTLTIEVCKNYDVTAKDYKFSIPTQAFYIYTSLIHGAKINTHDFLLIGLGDNSINGVIADESLKIFRDNIGGNRTGDVDVQSLVYRKD